MLTTPHSRRSTLYSCAHTHMRIAVVGGGPGGLYFAALTQQLDPSHEITVWERNADDDTFGFGVVFSDETLGGIEHADPVVHGAMSRQRLLQILQARCRELGVTLRFNTEAPPARELALTHDLVVGADGVNSTTRGDFAETFRPTLDVRRCRFMWLGTDLVFDAF